jgi:ankyrin repeat protein
LPNVLRQPPPAADSREGRVRALHTAVAAGNGTEVKRLLAAGVSPDAVDPTNASFSPLIRAIGEDQRAIAALLIDAKADVNAATEAGTPLQFAAEFDFAWAVDLLLTKGADAGARDKQGWTALHHACDHARTAVARLLLDHKAPVKRKAVDGMTPLHLAVAVDKPDKALVALLLERGAYLNEENNAGDTALHLAVTRDDRSEIVALLLAAKPDLSAQNEAGETPLHVAARTGNVEAIKALLELNPDLTIPAKNPAEISSFGRNFGGSLTPYQMARLHHHREAADQIAAAEKVADEKKDAGEKAK